LRHLETSDRVAQANAHGQRFPSSPRHATNSHTDSAFSSRPWLASAAKLESVDRKHTPRRLNVSTQMTAIYTLYFEIVFVQCEDLYELISCLLPEVTASPAQHCTYSIFGTKTSWIRSILFAVLMSFVLFAHGYRILPEMSAHFCWSKWTRYYASSDTTGRPQTAPTPSSHAHRLCIVLVRDTAFTLRQVIYEPVKHFFEQHVVHPLIQA
jgi:hypothetical protein